jgi:hypothetical protein
VNSLFGSYFCEKRQTIIDPDIGYSTSVWGFMARMTMALKFLSIRLWETPGSGTVDVRPLYL